MAAESVPTGKYRSALDVATRLAKEAGGLIRAEFLSETGVAGHGGHADVDTAAERLIRAGLALAFPDHGRRGEELAEDNCAAKDAERHVWLIDPHDGTSDAIKGHRGAAVSIALLRDGVPVLGVVYAYAAPGGGDDLIAWAEGCGPIQRQGCAVQRPIAPQADAAANIVLMSQSAEKSMDSSARFVSPGRARCLPSIAYRLALVAVGDAEAATSFNGPIDWDYAGGHALVLGAGGVLLDGGGDPVRYEPDGRSSVGRMCVGGVAPLVDQLIRTAFSPASSPPSPPPRYGLVRPTPGRIVADDELVQRACGCLMGQLAGDNLGGFVEFQSDVKIRHRFPQGLRTLQDGGHWNLLAGQPTDDSELALLLARSILAAEEYDASAAAAAYGYWYTTDPFDVGTTTSRAVGPAAAALAKGGDPLKAALAAASTTTESNGSLMRIAPLGIYGACRSPAEVWGWALEDAATTHNSPVCRQATGLFAVAVAHAIGSGDAPQAVYEHALACAESNAVDERVKAALLAARHQPPDRERFNGDSQGSVLVAFQNAFYQLLHAPSLEAGVVDTVMSGGDTDTNAAIAGGLLGAVHGLANVPSQWTRSVLSCRPLAGAAGVHHPRPQDLWPIDALPLAERLLWLGIRSPQVAA